MNKELILQCYFSGAISWIIVRTNSFFRERKKTFQELKDKEKGGPALDLLDKPVFAFIFCFFFLSIAAIEASLWPGTIPYYVINKYKKRKSIK